MRPRERRPERDEYGACRSRQDSLTSHLPLHSVRQVIVIDQLLDALVPGLRRGTLSMQMVIEHKVTHQNDRVVVNDHWRCRLHVLFGLDRLRRAPEGAIFRVVLSLSFLRERRGR